MKDKKDIKILISCHKPTEYISNDALMPIQVGSSLGNTRLSGMLHDDEGDNISNLNHKYCELTAQYWAWKNLNCEYYGFFHYRRYLSFADFNGKFDGWGNVPIKCLTPAVEDKLGLDADKVASVLQEYDVILPNKKDVWKFPHEAGRDMRQLYASNGYLNPEDLEMMLDVIAKKCPEYLDDAKSYLKGHKTYLNNMFVMKKEIFDNYCEWLFDILTECDKRIDYTNYSIEGIRTPGHLAERLFNIYIIHLKKEKKYRFKELQTIVFEHTEPITEIKPAFEYNNNAIVFSANDTYAPYLAPLFYSIKKNISKDQNYDIIILTRDMSKVSEKRLRDIFADNANVSIRCVNVCGYDKYIDELPIHSHFSIETYFRLALPEVLKSYDKVLYLDGDMIVNADLADLYSEDIEGYLLGACHDADTAGLYNGAMRGKKKYMDEVLKIKDPYGYFQCGVLLLNLAEFRKTYKVSDMFAFAGSNRWELVDQDVMNYLAQGKVKYLDMAWNSMFDWKGLRISKFISHAPKRLYDEYMAAHNAPKIIHYAGPDKPWSEPASDLTEFFWENARQTVYYEELLYRMNSHEYSPSGVSVKKAPLSERLDKRFEGIFPKYTLRREFMKWIWRRVTGRESNIV